MRAGERVGLSPTPPRIRAAARAPRRTGKSMAAHVDAAHDVVFEGWLLKRPKDGHMGFSHRRWMTLRRGVAGQPYRLSWAAVEGGPPKDAMPARHPASASGGRVGRRAATVRGAAANAATVRGARPSAGRVPRSGRSAAGTHLRGPTERPTKNSGRRNVGRDRDRPRRFPYAELRRSVRFARCPTRRGSGTASSSAPSRTSSWRRPSPAPRREHSTTVFR